MRKDHTYKVECACGASYTQTIESLDDTGERSKPYICGLCGSRDIRVWHLLYDALGILIQQRKEA